jgi:membrane fusion protein
LTPPPQPSERSLFRHEVLANKAPKLAGQILLTPRLSTWMVALFAGVMAAAVVAMLFFGSYTRRATVSGLLVPSAGLMRVATPQAGVVIDKRIKEGQVVQKGEILYVLTTDRLNSEAREIQASIGVQVEQRKRSMESEIARNALAQTAEITQMERRLAALSGEAQAVERQIEQQKLRVALAEDARARYQSLADRDFIAREQLFQKETELAEARSRLEALNRDTLIVQKDLAGTRRDLDATRVRYAGLNAALQRGVSTADQELAEVESRRRIVVPAPESGRASLVVAEVGQAVDPSRPLASLVPTDSQLEVRLYAPSRTVGFVKTGNRVLLRFQAFPYQKFGHQEGVVTAVSTNSASTTELSGLPLPELPPGEPVFSITVRLKDQSIMAYGSAIALQAGMRVEADILQEKRRLWEWVLEPLYSVTGRLR